MRFPSRYREMDDEEDYLYGDTDVCENGRQTENVFHTHTTPQQK